MGEHDNEVAGANVETRSDKVQRWATTATVVVLLMCICAVAIGFAWRLATGS